MKEDNLLIVGGTGTLGKGLVQKILRDNQSARITICSRDEVKQLEMMREFPSKQYPHLNFLLGDVRDLERMKSVSIGMSVVINCAAIKHVVIAEMNPDECRKTNVQGVKNIINACLTNSVKKCMLISTDKAVDPIGVYGQSKRQSEKLMLEANSGSELMFSIVRLGNIIGSRASVAETFIKDAGKGVFQITDMNATRFGLKRQEAANFLLDSVNQMQGGEIFSPKMKAFRIADLAKVIAPDNQLEIIGLRPGDKLHEVIEDEEGRLLRSDETQIMEEKELVEALKS